LACHAQPRIVLADAGVRESASAVVGFSLQRAFFLINARDDRGVAVNMRCDALVDDLSRLQARIFDAFEELLFVHDRAVVIDIDERGGEQLIQRFGVLGLLGAVPEIFECQNSALVARLLRRERMRSQRYCRKDQYADGENLCMVSIPPTRAGDPASWRARRSTEQSSSDRRDSMLTPKRRVIRWELETQADFLNTEHEPKAEHADHVLRLSALRKLC
jgi:hypothetical protein